MKYIQMNFKYWAAALMLTGGMFTASCSDDIILGEVNDGRFDTPEAGEVVAYVSDNAGKRMFSNLEFRSEGEIAFTLKTNKAATGNSTITMSYDETVLAEYNGKYGYEFEAVPQSMLAFENDGVISIDAGSTASAPAKITLTSDGTLDAEKTYVLPLRMKVTSGDFRLAETDQTRLVMVKDLTGLPDCTKYALNPLTGQVEPGVKVFSCMEVNDTNPLNNLSFTLKKTGQPLVDCLIIFAANINYNEQTGKVYIFNNENVQALLDNREHYLKPLQDRGMKIILGLLGNHDRSGIANMSKETAEAFALEVKAMCDAYDLDGIFVDDEYSDYEYSDITPGFVYPGKPAAARLCYEVKKANPDRWVIAYAYSTTYGLPDVDGVPSGEFVDYALHDYGGSSDLSTSFPGMPKSNQGLYSQEFNQGRTASESSLTSMRNRGYLSHMIFAMDPNRSNFSWVQLPAMQRMAKCFYDDELVFDGVTYPKDWIK